MLLPDDLVLPTGVLTKMAAVRERHGGSVLCAFDIPREEISAYGVFDVDDTEDSDVKRVKGMVEKPAAEDAPSTFAAAGRYLLDRAIFDALKRITPGAGGELAADRRGRAADRRGTPRARGRPSAVAATTWVILGVSCVPPWTSPSITRTMGRNCGSGCASRLDDS